MKLRLPSLLIIFAVLAVGCNSAATAAFPTSIMPPAPTLTRMPITNTLEPTLTATLPPSPAMETSTLSPEDSSFYATATAIVKELVGTAPSRVYASFLSPNRKWRVDVRIYDCVQVQAGGDENAFEQLNLTQLDEGSESTIDSQLQYCRGLGAYGLGGLFWSPSSQYFYYTVAREGLPDGLCGYWARPINRVDVLTKEVEFVGDGHFSPDKTKMAFWQDDEIVIWSLDGGEIARVPALTRGAFSGEIAWSPDSQSLVYLQTESDCSPFGKSYVTRLDLSGPTQTLLLESDSRGFWSLVWDAPYRISLVDDEGNRWRYNLISKELQPVP